MGEGRGVEGEVAGRRGWDGKVADPAYGVGRGLGAKTYIAFMCPVASRMETLRGADLGSVCNQMECKTMRPPYYLFYYRDGSLDNRPRAVVAPRGDRFILVACSIVMAGLIGVAFLSGW